MSHVHLFDSGCLSTGIGHMVLRAAKMAKQGAGVDEILAMLADLKKRVATSASAAISGNCGPGAFGVLFVKAPEKE